MTKQGKKKNEEKSRETGFFFFFNNFKKILQKVHGNGRHVDEVKLKLVCFLFNLTFKHLFFGLTIYKHYAVHYLTKQNCFSYQSH